MKNNYKPVVCTQDETGDWYILPNELSDSFNAYFINGDMENDYELQDEFEEKFGKYRTGGDLNLTQLYIKKDDKD